ncbi:MAG: cytochrome C [Burkholderiales bacterium]
MTPAPKGIAAVVLNMIGRRRRFARGFVALSAAAGALLVLAPQQAQALPAFARQTGQNCVACHAGGQFPELTPYGRLFKMTGYTIGERALPLSMMGLVTASKVSNTSKSDNPPADFQKDGSLIFATGSVFVAGKITNNLGLFTQVTYDNYAGQSVAADGAGAGKFQGHTNADNMDFRYADHFINTSRDLIYGISLNNNPSVSDPWNTAPAWMQYVPVPSPTSSAFVDGNAPYPGYAAGGNIAGLTAYAYLNKAFYAELGGYTTANGAFSFMSAGINNAGTTKLKGMNPYWRFAYTHEWGPHNIMIGTSGMNSDVYDNPEDTSDPSSVHRFNDRGIDAQYQYLLDPHTVTAQIAYMTEKHRYPDFLANQPAPGGFVDAAGNPLPNTNASDTTHTLRAKLTYTYQAKYGGSLGYFNLTGTTNTANQTSGYDPTTGLITSDPTGALGATALSTRVGGNLSGNPATSGFTYEAFWIPVQYVRVGMQYTSYSKYNGASSNYDGLGRDAKDNNTVFFYIWGAY